METLGERIGLLRESAGLSQMELSRIIEQQIGKYAGELFSSTFFIDFFPEYVILSV